MSGELENLPVTRKELDEALTNLQALIGQRASSEEIKEARAEVAELKEKLARYEAAAKERKEKRKAKEQAVAEEEQENGKGFDLFGGAFDDDE